MSRSWDLAVTSGKSAKNLDFSHLNARHDEVKQNNDTFPKMGTTRPQGLSFGENRKSIGGPGAGRDLVATDRQTDHGKKFDTKARN